MKTYTENEGYLPFNWKVALENKEIDWQYLRNKAGKWVTCACGNQCSILPRNYFGEPLDFELSTLGMRFYQYIKEQDTYFALVTLEKIEERSAFLIRNMPKF